MLVRVINICQPIVSRKASSARFIVYMPCVVVIIVEDAIWLFFHWYHMLSYGVFWVSATCLFGKVFFFSPTSKTSYS